MVYAQNLKVDATESSSTGTVVYRAGNYAADFIYNEYDATYSTDCSWMIQLAAQ